MIKLLKKTVSFITAFSLLLALSPIMFLNTASAATVECGPLLVTGGTSGVDYVYDGLFGQMLTIKTSTPLTIKNKNPDESAYVSILLEKNVDVNVTFAGLNISYDDYDETNTWVMSADYAFMIPTDSTGNVNITLAKGTKNYLKSGNYYAGITKSATTKNVGTLTIGGEGTLEAVGGKYAPGIGAEANYYSTYKTGNITITGGTVIASGGAYGAGIGGSVNYAGQTDTYKKPENYKSDGAFNIKITGGVVTAQAGGDYQHKVNASGIGSSASRYGVNGGTLDGMIITGGSVKASGYYKGPSIGGANGAVMPTLSDKRTSLYLLEIDNPNGESITINNTSYPSSHNGESKIYAYLPAKSFSSPNIVKVGSTISKYYYSNSKWIKVVDIPKIDTTVYTYNGESQTYKIAESDDYSVEGNVQTDADQYDVAVKLNDSTKSVWSNGKTEDQHYSFTIKQAIPVITRPVAQSVNYGESLSSSILSDGWSWEDSSIVPALKNDGYTAVKTVTDYNNYDYENVDYQKIGSDFSYNSETYTLKCTVSVTVNQFTPNEAAPAASKITYGTPLSGSQLTEGWSWAGDTTVIPTFDNTGFTAQKTVTDYEKFDYSRLSSSGFTYDAENHLLSYNVVVPVEKAAHPAVPDVPTSTPIVYEQKLSESALSVDGWRWCSGNTIPTVTNSGYDVEYPVDDVNYNYVGVEGYNSSTHSIIHKNLAITVSKAAPKVTLPEASTITYGQSLSDSTLTDGWEWVTPSAKPDMSNRQFDVIKTVDDENYDYSKDSRYDSEKHMVTRTIAVPLAGAKPLDVTVPTASAIDYGYPLSQSQLSSSDWSWVDGSVIPTVKNNGYKAKIVVDDSDANYDYSKLEGYDKETHTITRTISVKVNKATPVVTVTPASTSAMVGDTVMVTVTASNPNNTSLEPVFTLTFDYVMGDTETNSPITGMISVIDQINSSEKVTIKASTIANSNYNAQTASADISITTCRHTNVSSTWTAGAASHWHVCLDCGAKVGSIAHTGGTATCKDKAICTVCKEAYGTVDSNNHISKASVWSKDSTGHWHECGYCHAHVDEAAHVSKSAATPTKAETCKDCGYEIAPAAGYAAVPVITPNGGTYTEAQTVTITSATEGAAIYYTTDGTAPTTASTLYTGEFTVEKNTTVKAIAVKGNMGSSSVKTASFTINLPPVETPVITPNGGTYTEAQTVTITSATEGAAIYYTTDGTVPTTASTLYTGEFTVEKNTTVKAIAVKSGMNDSAVKTSTIKISLPVVETPVITPNGGTYTEAQTVTITSATEGAAIYYTTDGTAPTTASTLYTGEFTVEKNTTVKAIAVKSGMNDSAAAQAVFSEKKSSGNSGSTPNPTSGKTNTSHSSTTIQSESSADPTSSIGSSGWNDIAQALSSADSGDSVTISMNGKTVVPKSIFESIKGKDVTIVFDMGNGFTWSINGKDVTDPKYVDMGVSLGSQIPVSVINKVTGECASITITLDHEGEFGFTATLSVNLGSDNSGLYANLYYYKGGEDVELISSGIIDSTGIAKVDFTHASEYIVVIDDSDHMAASDNTAEKDDDKDDDKGSAESTASDKKHDDEDKNVAADKKSDDDADIPSDKKSGNDGSADPVNEKKDAAAQIAEQEKNPATGKSFAAAAIAALSGLCAVVFSRRRKS